ncbi:nucleoside-diphosphate sugar epimerase/dehydratase [Thioclava sp. GXIMD4216]|uniref:Nucleoside-diphosphate sugar epimerase/dehydratase n=1 Tax=Thioclava litoralis TaxID=3076557 RepID=A0ABZ1E2B4_9RHOB|nr:nucleoside-diphosphate sugar epimerase/dehydratase [Thioclava sp. FTW29]
MASFTRRLVALDQKTKFCILAVIDLLMVPLTFWVALLLRFGVDQAAVTFKLTLIYLPFLLMVSVGLGSVLGMFNRKLKDYDGEAVLRSLAISAALGVSSYLLSLISHADSGLRLHILFAITHFIGTLGMRQGLYYLLVQIYRQSNVVSRIAIYGAGRTGMALAHELRNRPGMMVYAFLDDNGTLDGMNLNGVPIFSGVHADRVLDRYKINKVILAMPSVSVQKQTFISKRLARFGVDVETLPAFARLSGETNLLNKLMPAGTAALLPRENLEKKISNSHTAYRGRTVMISGAGGSIGIELCRQVMTSRPAKLVLFELSEYALYLAEAEMRVLGEAIGCEIVPVLGSVCDSVHVTETLSRYGVEVVLHAAAYKHVPLVEGNARVGISNNALGTAVLARAARDCGVRRFVLVSTDKAVRPSNLMGASKRFAELTVQDLAGRSQGTIYSIVRFGNVMGSSGSVIPLFKEQIARGGPVTVTDPRMTRYFMTIPEAARLVLAAGAFAEGGEVYVLDMGRPMKIVDLAGKLINAAGFSVRSEDNPEGDIEITFTGLRPGEKLHEELMVRKGAQTTDHPKIIRVREDMLSELEMAAALRDLRDAVDMGDTAAVLEVILKAVPDYVPRSLPEDALQLRLARQLRDKRQERSGDTPAE